jgi:RHS repeat-associated protein
VTHRFGFTGRAFDAESGLQNNLNRWYDAVTGQWMSEDPIGFAAGDSTLRRYVAGDVLNALDPYGLQVTENDLENLDIPGMEGYVPVYLADPGDGLFMAIRDKVRIDHHIIGETQTHILNNSRRYGRGTIKEVTVSRETAFKNGEKICQFVQRTIIAQPVEYTAITGTVHEYHFPDFFKLKQELADLRIALNNASAETGWGFGIVTVGVAGTIGAPGWWKVPFIVGDVAGGVMIYDGITSHSAISARIKFLEWVLPIIQSLAPSGAFHFFLESSRETRTSTLHHVLERRWTIPCEWTEPMQDSWIIRAQPGPPRR